MFVGSGWDIVVPSGWGMCVWMSLVYCGAMPGGLREAETLHLELDSPLPPHLLPDTPAGESYARCLEDKRRVEYFNHPPASRLNFIKLGVQFPFSHPWRRLAQEWMPGTQQVYALMDPDALRRLAVMVNGTTKPNVTSRKRKMAASDNVSSPKKKRMDDAQGEGFIDNPNDTIGCSTADANDDIARQLWGVSEYGCLVRVRLELCYGGTLEPCAMICLPTEEDLSTRERAIKPSERRRREGDITELPHQDNKAQFRTQLRKEHRKIKVE